jgi:DNA-binding MarR family transcriptional regulator
MTERQEIGAAMTAATLSRADGSSASAHEDPEVDVLEALVETITNLDDLPQKSHFDALGDLLLDAVLGGRRRLLDEAVERLRAAEVEYRRAVRRRDDLDAPLSRLETLLSLATGARDRIPAEEDFALVAPGSRTHQVLKLIRRAQTVQNKDIVEELGIATAQVSRITADLGRRRLVARVKVGRDVYFDITPHGEDVLDDIAARRRKVRRPTRRVEVGQTSTPVLYGSTPKNFELRTDALRSALEQSGHPAGRSRALFAALTAHRPEVITDRLLTWDRFVHITAPERIEIRLPSLDTPGTRIAPVTWDILESLGQPVAKAHSAWPGPAPIWDGWAVVHGKRGRRDIVFLEAKSQSQELKSKPLDIGRNYDKTAWAEVLDGTCKYLKARRSWPVWPDYADAATRLAFIHQLQSLDIPAWWMNLYFVDPKRLLSKLLPATTAFWEDQIDAVRGALAISKDHPLSMYIRHEIVPIPEDGLELAMAA